ncbi:MAG: hypothetical protein HY936_04630 [Nitrosomonadales bacterium]|nr:hypothetical protein [Nitrosomonadales bacterium]
MAKGKMQRGGARGKLRAHFLANIGRVMDSDELRAVADNQSEWARCVRELRTEEGYLILTHNDRSELKPGQYLLETAKPQPAFERAISKETRAFVLDRNGFTCQMCGAVAGEPHPYDTTRKTRLHLGHIIDKSMGGTDDPSNLRAIVKRRYLKAFDVEGTGEFAVCVFEWGRTGWTGSTTFMASQKSEALREAYFDKQRDGKLVYKK